jgi:hypothetical protein
VELSRIISEIDAEIARLQQARSLLTAGSQIPARRGRKPKALTAASPAAAPKAGRRKKRKLSAEGRQRIREAMKRRWAEHRKNKGK